MDLELAFARLKLTLNEAIEAFDPERAGLKVYDVPRAVIAGREWLQHSRQRMGAMGMRRNASLLPLRSNR